MNAKKQYHKHTVSIFAVASILVVLIVGIMTMKNSQDLYAVLEDSVETQLISTSLAAREMIDVDKFISYNSINDKNADANNYNRVTNQLRLLKNNVGASYIYALKKQPDGTGLFVFDTGLGEDVVIFENYELQEIHERAFRGEEVAGILNLQDEFGNYNSGAVPIMRDREVVGIICTDFEDIHIRVAQAQIKRNTIILGVLLITTLTLMLLRLRSLMNTVSKMQEKLLQDAHYDAVTGLPNRKYLMRYLDEIVQENPEEPFALLFVDLDNFKKVNDNAGHDAGDELLKSIAKFLDNSTKNAKSFRPSAGKLNIAARVGGDEFIQVVRGVSTVEETQEVIDHLFATFKQEHHHNRHIEKYNVGMSIGAALYPFHSDNFHVLIKYADIAMYNSKRNGKNSGSIYSDEMEGKQEK